VPASALSAPQAALLGDGEMAAQTPEKLSRSWRAFALLRNAVLLLRLFWIPLAISALASIIFTFPDQTREYYRILLENYKVLQDSPELLERSKFLTEVAGSVAAIVAMAACIASTDTPSELTSARSARSSCASAIHSSQLPG
jgi:ABC-type spermidine/putrescine transport system permease subunit I